MGLDAGDRSLRDNRLEELNYSGHKGYDVAEAQDKPTTAGERLNAMKSMNAEMACDPTCDPSIRDIPRVELRKKVARTRKDLMKRMEEIQNELRSLDQFERTFFSLAEAIQDGLAQNMNSSFFY